MTEEQGQAMWQQIRENQNKLDACPKHLFKLTSPPWPPFTKVKCENCGGEIDRRRILDYVQGYIAAGGNPEDIVPGWFA